MISKTQKIFVGVDGCKAGWLAIILKADNQWEVEVFPNVFKLWQKYCEASLIFIDIPIGLKANGPLERLCDIEARKLLGPPRASSVFRAPCRNAIYAESYENAKSINKSLTGKSLSIQTLSIIHKIREVDTLLCGDISSKALIKEVHPELCFWGLAGRPMLYNKRRAEGFSERLKVLRSYHSHADDIVDYTLANFIRKEVAKDDILDALVAAITAFGPLNSLPDPQELDSKGLPMQMIHRCFNRG